MAMRQLSPTGFLIAAASLKWFRGCACYPHGQGTRRGGVRLCEFFLHSGNADAGKAALHAGKGPEVLPARFVPVPEGDAMNWNRGA